jgi:hypothetical protein
VTVALPLLLALAVSAGGGAPEQPTLEPSVALEPVAQMAALPEAALPIAATRPAAPDAARLDACALLTRDEVAAVQGEPVRETRSHRQTSGGVLRLSCFYTLPTFSRSVSFELAVDAGQPSGGDAARQLWSQRFVDRRSAPAREAEGRMEADADERRGKEEGEGGSPLAVEDVGEQAYWVGSPLSGALYVLQGDAVVRISIGGSEPVRQRIDRARWLAEKAVARLPSP